MASRPAFWFAAWVAVGLAVNAICYAGARRFRAERWEALVGRLADIPPPVAAIALAVIVPAMVLSWPLYLSAALHAGLAFLRRRR